MRFVKTLIIQIFLGLLTVAVQAQDATTAPAAAPEAASGYNMVAILMIVISLVLIFVIYSMGQVLIAFLNQLNEKRKQGSYFPAVILFFAGSLLSLTVKAQEMPVPEVVKAAPNYGGLSATAFYSFVAVIGIQVIVILVMMLFINRIKNELKPVAVKEKKSYDWSAVFNKLDKKLFTRAVAVEKELDIMLDHEYDGIRELDNSLPPWWKYGFIITIIVAGIYLMHFHVLGTGKNPTQEYEAELAQAKIEMDAYAAQSKEKIDESNIKMSDEAGIADGNQIYQQMCWACHGKLGEGGAGPNLTDKYWIHEGSMNAIYASIKHGYPDKGMQAWEKQYSPKQINHLVSFIATLQGTNPPGGKEPQGDIWEDAGAASGGIPKADSTTTATK